MLHDLYCLQADSVNIPIMDIIELFLCHQGYNWPGRLDMFLIGLLFLFASTL
jgi:hypothetical protein